ncbi:MAG TPA: hypothetical protein PKH65_07080 [Bacteroidia bacterium]|nr:hypothetical protein [Bacteroidia bacterium]
MNNEINDQAVKEFNEKLVKLSKEYYPSLPPSNLGIIVLYKKLVEIEKQLKGLNK